VGFSLGMVGVTIWYPAVVIGIVTGLVSWLGLRLGGKLGGKFGKRMEIIGGLVLIGIGMRILLVHSIG
jgi:putative Mn2+ efflux pump MntP